MVIGFAKCRFSLQDSSMFAFFGDGSKSILKNAADMCTYIFIYIYTYIYIHLDLPKGAKWFLKGCQFTMIYHPLGFNWHPLEGAGIFPFGISP